MKITATEALVKLKLLDKKINEAVSQVSVGFIKKKNDNSFPAGVPSREAFKTLSESSLQSVNDLIRQRDLIKKALVESNAKTPVQVGTVTMTVAEAIERKSSVKYTQTLVKNYLDNLAAAKAQVETQNARLQAAADDFVNKSCAGATNLSVTDRENLRKGYLESNLQEVVYSEKVEQKCKALRDEVLDFLANVDTALSLVNATTVIEV